MAAPSREGEILDGKYRILRKLGEGGMGAVYAGENIRVKKTVAIKILHASASAVEEMAQRFEKEAQAAGQIGNDHIVEVHDLGMTSAGERYMVMEYLEGESLRARIRRHKRLEPHDIVPIMVQMLEGLEAAHRAGIIHRDLKPDNVFIVRSRGRAAGEFVKVLDFGISKFSGTDGSTTQAGTVMGSPNYMSPEHVKSSSEVDARSDVYAVGVMLFEALTGSVPRKAANFAELLFKVAYEPMPDPRTLVPGVPDALVDVIFKACATAADARYQSAQELSRALELLLSALGPPPPGSFAELPPASLSSPSASSGPGLLTPPPSFRMFATPPAVPVAAHAPSQPSYGAASPSLAAFSQSNPALTARSLTGPNADPAMAMGTEVISLGGSASHPSFASAMAPMAAPPAPPASEAPSQPSFTTPSQPSFTSSSQPSYGSQPGMGTTAGVALGAPEHAAVARPRQNAMAALLAGLALGALGLGGAALYVAFGAGPSATGGKPGDEGSRGAATATVAPTVASAPATQQPVGSAPSASAVAEVSAVAPASASASATPTARPLPVRFGGKKKLPDPGY